MSLKYRKRLIIEIVTTAIIFFANITLEKDYVPQTLQKENYRKEEIVLTGIVDGKAFDSSVRAISVKEQTIEYFNDVPIMAHIAYCESKFTHYKDDGSVLRGEVTPDDIGVMQINEYYHGKTAKLLGIDIHTLEGNLAYAKWLYEREGTQPWVSSQKCWSGNNKIAMR